MKLRSMEIGGVQFIFKYFAKNASRNIEGPTGSRFLDFFSTKKPTFAMCLEEWWD